MQYKLLVLDGGILTIVLTSIICLTVIRVKTEKGIGLRVVQFLGVTVVVPLIVLLSFEGIIGKDAIISMMGAALGWTLSTLTKDR